jgi:hypothetical protein
VCNRGNRSTLYLPSVEEAMRERGHARDKLDRLIEAMVPEIGRQAANVLSDAATDLVARAELEYMARLVTVMQAVAGGPGDVFVAPAVHGT